ncbi:hypothetical protein L195_g012478 [Trifolium pratense]|uniref:DUF4283 domain-containing protein n=1 Tax=Trifolium pratense TaxID=57577 RepID=A0A2K3PKI6_TRIPR|nr:hypothetical protein L195_g012478 [Trifolium pratense]
MEKTNALLGFTEAAKRTNIEDDELRERSAKKKKGEEKPYEAGSSMPVSYADIHESPRKREHPRNKSYKDSVLGVTSDEDPEDEETCEFADGEDERTWRDEDAKFTGMEVIEKKLGDHACPDFVLTEEEEARLQKPWRNGVIVKLLGRKIGYKALETRLKQMWVRNGIINIVDVGNDFFLVTFTSKEDHYRALIDGPWMIYDNYLVVREWSPNFHPSGEVIEKVAVWVRFSGLPIEYYDTKMLHFIGNRIGRTVKVDRTTQTQARGKYARLCVEVDLTKPLLAMFQIKDRCYKVEYEGLHMLCLVCGTFGHYKEGCVAKTNNNASNGEKAAETNRGEALSHASPAQEGPWRVVQKNRRPRKKVEGGRTDGTGATGGHPPSGSRFDILQENNARMEEEDHIVHTDAPTSIPRVTQSHGEKHVARKEVIPVIRAKSGGHIVDIAGNMIPFEFSSGPTPTAHVQNREAIKRSFNREAKTNEYQMEGVLNQTILSGSKGGVPEGGVNKVAEVKSRDSSLGHPTRGPKHSTRPPDIVNGSLISKPVLQRVDVDSGNDCSLEGVGRVTSDTTMEIVDETPISKHGEAREDDMTLN